MGTWARRIIKVEMADPSFKFQDEHDLVDFLNEEADVYGDLHDGGGELNVPLSVLRKALRNAGELNLAKATIKNLKEDIKAAKLQSSDLVTYSCF